jgi:hypothetical protein
MLVRSGGGGTPKPPSFSYWQNDLSDTNSMHCGGPSQNTMSSYIAESLTLV